MNTFFISDSHFNHARILTFLDKEGNRIRNFNDVNEMNEFMIEKWNSVVGKNDKVYHLGDINMKNSRESFDFMNKLNGEKILIKGNHDSAKIDVYVQYFRDIRSDLRLKTGDGNEVVFTHRPIRMNDLGFDEMIPFNVHGHTHQNIIPDVRYINVCVENINYTPVSWNEIVAKINAIKSNMA